MPFREQEPREDPDVRAERERKRNMQEWEEQAEREQFDRTGEWDKYNRDQDAWKLGTPMPPMPPLDDPWRGLEVGNVPMPKWVGPPDLFPGAPHPDRRLGVPREAMDPKNFPLQRILDPQYPHPPPPHSPQGPAQ